MTTTISEPNSADATTASLGMILFLAAEGMFFLGLLSALTVIGPAHGGLFRRSATELSRPGMAASILCLIAMSATAFRRPWPLTMRWTAVGLGIVFLALQALQSTRLLSHETVIAPVDGKVKILDGTTRTDAGQLTVSGTMTDLPNSFDPHDVQLPAGGVSGTFTVPVKAVTDRQSYGPGRSNFFSSYFILTGAHAIHLLGGLVALVIVTLRRRPRCPAVALYWHTMNAIGAVCLVALWTA